MPTGLGDLVEALGHTGVALYSLQVGDAARELDRGASIVEDLSRRLRDWRDTARYMAALDLIVSVDSAPLHLAGATGAAVHWPPADCAVLALGLWRRSRPLVPNDAAVASGEARRLVRAPLRTRTYRG